MPRASTVHAVIAIGIDLGKSTLHMIGLDSCGAIVLREKVSRGRIASKLANLPPCLIGIEAGMATHYVARDLTALGPDVKQVPDTYAKPFRQGHKNDFRDAHAVAEAVQRLTTRFVPAKTDEQLDLLAPSFRARSWHDRFTPMNGHIQRWSAGPKSAPLAELQSPVRISRLRLPGRKRIVAIVAPIASLATHRPCHQGSALTKMSPTLS
jgi:hypothetical protein